LSATWLNACDIVAKLESKQFGCARTHHLEATEVGYVEEANIASRGFMLGQNALVLDRHLPPAEVGEPGTSRLMDGM